jgi:hypothetical protein
LLLNRRTVKQGHSHTLKNKSKGTVYIEFAEVVEVLQWSEVGAQDREAQWSYM